MTYEINSLKKTVNDMIRMTAIIAFGTWQEREKQPKFIDVSQEDSMYIKLLRMIDKGRINEAENILWGIIQSGKLSDLQLALDVYAYLNEKSDEFLEGHNFERIEIKEGVSYVVANYGYHMVMQ